MSAAPTARPRFNAGIGTPLSPPLGVSASFNRVHQGMPSSDQSNNGRISDSGWCVDQAFGETATTMSEQVAAQLAFDTPMLTAKGGALF